MPGVKDACLRLQDDHKADVNLILFLLYRGSLQQQLSQETIKQADDKTRSFRERVIQPIQALRKALKDKRYNVEVGNESLYQEMLSFELSAEKLAQTHLETIDFVSNNGQTAILTATNNLYAYATLLGISHTHLAMKTLLSHIKN